MTTRSLELAKECKRRSETCLYTAGSFFVWLKVLRGIRVGLIVVGLAAGSLAGWKTLEGSGWLGSRIVVAVAAFVAGLIPTIMAALRLDEYIETVDAKAGEFANLRDAFRQAALVSSLKGFSAFERDVVPLNERLERARSESITPPRWCFMLARRGIKAGDYAFDVDSEAIRAVKE